VREQFVRLVALQQLDDHLRGLERERYSLPQRLQEPERAYQASQQEAAHLQATIEQSERQQRALERELDSFQAAVAKTQVKLRDVKTNKEYSAILTEIATSKENLASLEDQLLHLMEDVDQQRLAFQEQKRRVQEAERAVQQCQRELQAASEGLAQDIAAEQEKRQQTLAQLDAKLAETYEKLAMQNAGRVVAQLHDGVCGACHLKVQPQLVSEIRLQEALFTCPHCRLLLLWPV
jgi:hypothetical protein